jgi:hypothetical protein
MQQKLLSDYRNMNSENPNKCLKNSCIICAEFNFGVVERKYQKCRKRKHQTEMQTQTKCKISASRTSLQRGRQQPTTSQPICGPSSRAKPTNQHEQVPKPSLHGSNAESALSSLLPLLNPPPGIQPIVEQPSAMLAFLPAPETLHSERSAVVYASPEETPSAHSTSATHAKSDRQGLTKSDSRSALGHNLPR